MAAVLAAEQEPVEGPVVALAGVWEPAAELGQEESLALAVEPAVVLPAMDKALGGKASAETQVDQYGGRVHRAVVHIHRVAQSSCHPHPEFDSLFLSSSNTCKTVLS